MNFALLFFCATSLLHWDGNQHYLLNEANQPVLLFGHYYPGVVENAMMNAPAGNTVVLEAPYTIATYTNMALANNWNCIRLWQGEAAGGPPGPSTNLFYDVFPWARTGPGLAADGSNKVDFTTFDPAYFTRLTNAIQSFDSLGVYCSVR